MAKILVGKLSVNICAIGRDRLRGVQSKIRRDAVCLVLVALVVASIGTGLLSSNSYPVSADAGAWSVVGTPGRQSARNDILNPVISGLPTGSEIHDMAAGNDAVTVVTAVTVNTRALNPAAADEQVSVIYSTRNAGISWSTDAYLRLINKPAWQAGHDVFNIAIACDSSTVWVVTTGAAGPREIWITTDAGQNWDLSFDGIGLDTNETIRCLDISRDWGGSRDLAFGTVGGTAGGRWVVRPSSGFSVWAPQLNPNGVSPVPLGQAAGSNLNFHSLKFSPNYNPNAASPSNEPSVAMVCSNASATYYNIALRDYDTNQTVGYAFLVGIEVINGLSVPGASPGWDQLNRVCLQLPSDFRGISAPLRRAYISLDAYSFKSAGSCEDGIFRIDDTTVYGLMDTTGTPAKSVYSIAYCGTYASGKLLVGERMGVPCTATAPTWFTDEPTTCPIPCWYPALKPATGAANQGTCTTVARNGVAGAIVRWNAEGSLGLCATGSGAEAAGINWWSPLLAAPIPNDESAFSITRNNAESWNQIGLIDTTVDWFNDVAPSFDGTTIYLSSSNRSDGSGCDEFDSVWRSTTNNTVAAPLAVISPIGTYWERVYCRATAGNCSITQSDLPLLRVVNNGIDKTDGEMVAWAAQGAVAGVNSGVMAWSPDYGGYWASITPREPVQDFAFASVNTMYVLFASGGVQRMPYTGTSWSTNLPTYSTGLQGAHTITSSTSNVLVGASAATNSAGYAASISQNSAETWSVLQQKLPTNGNVHVAFDRSFASNSIVYAADDNGPLLSAGSPHVAGSLPGAVYRNTAPASGAWVNIMSRTGGARGPSWWPSTTIGDPPHRVGQFGVVVGASGPALFSAHDKISLQSASGPTSTPVASAVCYTGVAANTMPQPGIDWQCLNAYSDAGVGSTASDTVRFTLEPSSLKGGGNMGQVLYAIDDEAYGQYLGADTGYLPVVSPPVRGCLWSFATYGFIAPTVTVGDGPSDITGTSVTLDGILINGGGEPCKYRFSMGTSPGVYTASTAWSIENLLSAGQPFHAHIDSLTGGTKYYYVAECNNSVGTGSSDEDNFKTVPTNTGTYGYMGIGVDNPQRPLHLVGNAALFERNSDSAGFIIKRTASNRWVFGVDELPQSQFVIKTYPEGQPAVVRMSIDLLGNITVPGTLSKGSGTFRIDHPLDPANKYLSHSFVESPDMLNVYNGNAVLDGEGKAVVKLPAYFEALNRDYSYQLEGVGSYAPLYIGREIKGNNFIIAGGRPGMKVSWQVIGIRQDPYADAHPIAVEQVKLVQ